MLLRALWLLAALVHVLIGLRLSDITDDIAPEDIIGNLSAFADFNSDKATDILVLNSTSTNQSLYLWNKGKSQFQFFSLNIPFLVAVRVGDFNGDGVLDLLCQQVARDDGCSSVYVAWLRLSPEGIPRLAGTTPLFNTSSNSFLMAVDVDGDHITDIVSTTCEQKHTPTVWISGGTEKTFEKSDLKNGGRVGEISSGYFLDLSSDCMPELVVFGQGDDASVDGERRLDVWSMKGRELVWKQNVSLHFPTAILVSPPTFVDMNGDGASEVVMVTCNKVNSSLNVCVDALVHIFFQSEYPGNDIINCKGNVSWELSFMKNVSVNLTRDGSLGVPVGVMSAHPVLGDLELDSSPDMLVPITKLSTNETFLLLLSGTRKGSFVPQWDNLMELPSWSAVTISFFDFWEDGVLDVLVQYKTQGSKWLVSAHRQSLSADHTFLKVLVLSGHCYTDCASSRLSYGTILPSASVAYSTTNRLGHTQLTTATPKSSSAPLQLPFILFGLGETPNFIEELTAGMAVKVPAPLTENKGNTSESTIQVRFRKWRNLVPNSQVIVIPIPPIKPRRWHLELYLTPSHLVYTTAGVLCALAVGLAVLIMLLHAREKYQDKQERKQAKHKFHFNAM